MSTPYDPSPELERTLRRWRPYATGAGVLLLAVSAIGAFINPGDFFHSYLIGWLFWLGVALGSMGFLMMQYLTGGAWGIVTRRTLEAATRTLPVVAALFVPLAFGMPYLYEWARQDRVRANALLQHREGYLNPAMFLLRTAFYLAVWIGFAHWLNRWSAEEDEHPGEPLRTRLAQLSAGGLIVYVFLITFASVDWAESLQTEFYSTIWGFLFVAGQGLTSIAFAIAAMWLLSFFEPMASVLRPSHFHDLGKLLLMMVMVWAYFSFSQLVIVWAGNLPHEISYYLPRFATSWGWLGVALIVAQFFVPFLLLLSRPLKRNAALLTGVVAIVLLMRYLDLVWIVLPGYHSKAFQMTWLTFTAPLGIGGIWLAAFFREWPKLPLLPVNAPELGEALAHETE
ncbi:MAG TPA: hypothetical protein VKX45_07555 [Bryobacteraceae bacterium]|jgi:hypothetical protein|nr:hypothetical protein [Bryobacteraceae bacterium]